jgi:hypothetical protein
MDKNNAFCTISTFSHLHQALTLARSIQRHHCQSRFYILLAENVTPDLADRLQKEHSEIKIHYVFLDQLNAPECVIRRMAFYYSPFEFCCALRGYLHRYMYDFTGHSQWIFLDGDTYALADMRNVFEQLNSANILLSPHLRKPIDVTNAPHLEWNVLWAGVYNGGFLAINKTSESKKFIDWFCVRLEKYGVIEPGKRGWNADQLWLNLVFHCFDNVQVVKEVGVNIGHWNVFDGELSCVDEKLFFNEKPLILFHFSGWSADDLNKVSNYTPPEKRLSLNGSIAWRKLSIEYAEQLQLNNLVNLPEYSFARFQNGKLIEHWMRRHYYDMFLQNNCKWQNAPFENERYFSLLLRIKLKTSALYVKTNMIKNLILRYLSRQK